VEQELENDSIPLTEIIYSLKFMGKWKHSTPNSENKIKASKQFTYLYNSGLPRNFVWEGGSSNSVEDRGCREWGSGGSSPLVRGSAQFANE
jgi:hypothetical protein